VIGVTAASVTAPREASAAIGAVSATGPRTRAILRRVYLAQAVGATIDGVALSTAVIYFSSWVGISAGLIGVVLGVAAIAALLLVVPIGILSDLVGLRRAAIALSMLAGVALATYALARDVWVYAIGATVFMVTQAGIGAVRQAIVASNVAPSLRVRGRAVLHSLLNAGIGAGTLIGTLVALAGGGLPFVIAFAAGSVAALGCAVLFVGLPVDARRARPLEPVESAGVRREPRLVALRDRRFVGISGLAAILQLTMPILSILLPLWILHEVHAPAWVAPAAIGLNTVLVLAVQTTWASRIRSDGDAARFTALAAAGLAVGCALYGAAALAPSGIATAFVIGGTLALTAGEIAGGAGTWQLAFSRIPSAAPGQYQAVFGLSGSVARVVGPLLALPLMLVAGVAGWIVLGLVMAAAAIALTVIGRRT
jgi:MFS family permease